MMETFLVVAFLIAHGLVHAAVWATPKPAAEPPPFDPAHSWALQASHVPPATQRSTSVGLAWVAALLLVVAGSAYAFDAGVWTLFAAAGAVVGLVLKGLWFNRWLSLGVALDLAVLVAALTNWPAGG